MIVEEPGAPFSGPPSKIVQLCPWEEQDVLLALHEDGSISQVKAGSAPDPRLQQQPISVLPLWPAPSGTPQ